MGTSRALGRILGTPSSTRRIRVPLLMRQPGRDFSEFPSLGQQQRATGSDNPPDLGARCSSSGIRSLPAYSLASAPNDRWASPSPMFGRVATDDGMLRSHSNMSLRGPRRTSPPARRAGGDAPVQLMSMVPDPDDGTVVNANEVVDETSVNATEAASDKPKGPDRDDQGKRNLAHEAARSDSNSPGDGSEAGPSREAVSLTLPMPGGDLLDVDADIEPSSWHM